MPFERELRDLSWVPRWSIVRTSKPQSVAEHSYYVAIYAEQIAQLIGWDTSPGATLALIKAALYHDIDECFTGDIPGPMKRLIVIEESWLRAVGLERGRRFDNRYDIPIDHEARAIIKVADVLDEAMFLSGEQQIGNRACMNILELVLKRLADLWFEMPAPEEVLRSGFEMMTEAILREGSGHSMEVPANNEVVPPEGNPLDRPGPLPRVTPTPPPPDEAKGHDPTRWQEPRLSPITKGFKDLPSIYGWMHTPGEKK